MGKQRGILRQSLTATDERAKLESELFGGVEVVKCYVWEGSFMDRIRRVRGTELGMIWRAFMIASVNTVLMLAVPAAAAVGAFGTYSLWTRQPLTPTQGAAPWDGCVGVVVVVECGWGACAGDRVLGTGVKQGP